MGYLVGRGGNTIKETMAKSGAGVRVLPKSDLPPCGCVGDEVVRACGSAGAVAAALRLLAGQIKAHPLRLGGLLYGGTAGRPPLMLAQATHADLAYIHPSLGGYFAAGPAAPGVGGLMGGHMGHAAHGGFSGTAVEVTFRMLAPVVRTGNIIGKGGEHVRRVRQETGARIKVRAGGMPQAAGCTTGAPPPALRLVSPRRLLQRLPGLPPAATNSSAVPHLWSPPSCLLFPSLVSPAWQRGTRGGTPSPLACCFLQHSTPAPFVSTGV